LGATENMDTVKGKKWMCTLLISRRKCCWIQKRGRDRVFIDERLHSRSMVET
jgi:hypothetical protein